MKKVNTLVKSSAWLLAGQMCSRGSLMLAAMILSRSFGADDFAAYSYFQLTVAMLSAYAAMGLGVTSSRYFSEFGYENSNGSPFPLGTLWKASIALAIVIFFVLLFVPNDWLTAGLDVPRWLLATGVLALTLQVVPGGAILGLEKYRQSAFISMFSGSVMLTGAYLAATMKSPALGMIAIVASSLVQSVGESLVVIKTVGLQRLATQPKNIQRDFRTILKFAGPMLLVSMMAASGPWLLGRLILSNDNATYNFSRYSIGLQWYAIALFLPGMVSRVILPRIVRLANNNTVEKKKIVQQGAWLAGAAAFSMAALISMFSPVLMQLYGYDSYETGWFITGYLLAAVIGAPLNTIGNAIVADGGQKQWLALTAIWLTALGSIGSIMTWVGHLYPYVVLAGAAISQTITALYVARLRKLI